MRILEFTTLAVTGFISCAEFGSYAFVHPVLRRLPQVQRVEVEQGLLKTFGRVMPVGMSFCVVLGISSVVDGSVTRAWAWCAAGSFVAALVSTVIVNVPINRATGTWDVDHPPMIGSRPGLGGSSSRACAHGCS